LNLGIVAHVDAGKTSLTERLLHATGALETLGSVDAGTTQTDSLALERQRGITIRAAVATFTVDGATVNLIDTPGHADFIAEVDRSLQVLDGAVLVISAVEGVQSQTVLLMRALARLRVPTLLFVNKLDRPGADPEAVLAAIRERLTGGAVPMGSARAPGSRTAAYVPFAARGARFTDALVDVLVDHDDALLAAVVDGGGARPTPEDLRARLAAQVAAAQVHPVLFGSAMTGAGIPELLDAVATLLPSAGGDPSAPVAGSVFKVERRPREGKVAYVRVFSGRIAVRDRLVLGPGREGSVAAVKVFEAGGPVVRDAAGPGQIALVSGLQEVRVGDAIGSTARAPAAAVFAPPTLETAVVARDPAQRGALHAALARLAEQDPLIDLRQDPSSGETLVSLYGEVQKEVVAHALAVDAGVEVEFRGTTTICIERPAGRGEAVERLGDPSNPYLATIGLTLEPGPAGSGLDVRLAVDLLQIPLYVYKTVGAFREALTEYVAWALRAGLAGWEVRDCVVTLTASAYTSPGTTAADVRKLTPRVVAAALRRAGTVVCEPIHRFRLEVPADTLAAVLRVLAQRRAVPQAPDTVGDWCTIDGDIPAAELARLQQALGGRTRGTGVLESHFDRYEPAPGTPRRPVAHDDVRAR
jgi:ribosomal protection tetracycline resistance protein